MLSNLKIIWGRFLGVCWKSVHIERQLEPCASWLIDTRWAIANLGWARGYWWSVTLSINSVIYASPSL
jgi:hypothetical protein